MKYILYLLIFLFTFSVSTAVSGQPVKAVIKKPYIASVAIADKKSDIYGSGVIIRKGSALYVLTAAHVIEHMTKKKKKKPHILSLEHPRPIPAIPIKIDSNDDLALLAIPKDKFVIVEATSQKELYLVDHVDKIKTHVPIATKLPFLGDDVWMISSPKGKYNTVTKGIMSNFVLHKRPTHKKYIFLFGTTASGYYASSGGGLFNERGELIGIFHMIWKNGKGGILPRGFYSVSLIHILKFLK